MTTNKTFDPEAVKSYYQPVGWKPYEVVAKADYDKLLELYRKAILIQTSQAR